MLNSARVMAGVCSRMGAAQIGRAAVAAPVFRLAGSPVHRSFSVSAMLSSNGRERFINSLVTESEQEKAEGNLPTFETHLGDFKMFHTVGEPETVLEASFGTDTVVIRLNINDCPLEEQEFDDDGEQPDAEPQPQFMVEVTEASGSTGFFECVGHNDGFFEVQRAGVKPAGVSDEVEIYYSDCSLWDSELVESAKVFLADKGLTTNFISELADYTFNKEYAEYRKMLEDMSNFVEKSS